MKGFLKPILALIFIIFIIFLIYWLWQRQPKANKTQAAQTATSTVSEKKSNKSITQDSLSINIQDGQVFDETKVKTNGIASPDSLILIISNSFDNLLSSNEKGIFESEIELTKNLNLLNVIELDKNLKHIKKHSFALYLQDKTSFAKTNLLSTGPVKNIFDNTITLTTPTGDKKVIKNNQTQISLSGSSLAVLPKNKQVTSSKETDIRVGDYVIAIGIKSAETEIQAQTLEIIRENKPELTKKYAVTKIASAPKNKIFSAYDLENNNLIQFNLDKNSKIYSGNKKSEEKTITKEKKAIIIYTPSTDNIVSSIYLLP